MQVNAGGVGAGSLQGWTGAAALIAGVGLSADGRARAAGRARLDLAQSATGLALVLFMWGHMFFVSSILLGKDAMWTMHEALRGLFLLRAGRTLGWCRCVVAA
jgi:fumarate reductase subunit C